jgi:hypothetical protein
MPSPSPVERSPPAVYRKHTARQPHSNQAQLLWKARKGMNTPSEFHHMAEGRGRAPNCLPCPRETTAMAPSTVQATMGEGGGGQNNGVGSCRAQANPRRPGLSAAATLLVPAPTALPPPLSNNPYQPPRPLPTTITHHPSRTVRPGSMHNEFRTITRVDRPQNAGSSWVRNWAARMKKHAMWPAA